MDNVSPEIRSKVMAKVRSNRNRSTEWRLRASLIRAGLRGWKMNPPDVCGKPDFVFQKHRLAVFVDGCFWHGCPKHSSKPATNRAFWNKKMSANKKRDQLVTRTLKKHGWYVVRIWQHALNRKNEVCCLVRIKQALGVNSNSEGMPK